MPTDTNRLIKSKDLIISTLQMKGPSLPIHIARAVNISTLFASAYLSELYSENKAKISNMKVGSSPLYYLEGQKAQLENFIEYLAPKEKEALALLKKEKLLEDEKLEPAIRVALGEIKDFAVPLKIKINDELKNFWKHFLIENKEIEQLILERYQRKKSVRKKEKVEKMKKEPQEHADKEIKEEKVEETNKKIETKNISLLDAKFSQDIQNYLVTKNIEILEIREQKKKDFIAKICINTLLGKQEFLLVAKNKKKVSEADFVLAFQKAQFEKLPLLIMAHGELDKKALAHMKEWKNFSKFEKIN
ncbi:MAG: hypothetical protein AABW65_01425 [Nanoarchaeota archaeon]